MGARAVAPIKDAKGGKRSLAARSVTEAEAETYLWDGLRSGDEADRVQASRKRSVDIRLPIIDEQAVGRRKAKSLASPQVDSGVWLGNPFFGRDHDQRRPAVESMAGDQCMAGVRASVGQEGQVKGSNDLIKKSRPLGREAFVRMERLQQGRQGGRLDPAGRAKPRSDFVLCPAALPTWAYGVSIDVVELAWPEAVRTLPFTASIPGGRFDEDTANVQDEAPDGRHRIFQASLHPQVRPDCRPVEGPQRAGYGRVPEAGTHTLLREQFGSRQRAAAGPPRPRVKTPETYTPKTNGDIAGQLAPVSRTLARQSIPRFRNGRTMGDETADALSETLPRKGFADPTTGRAVAGACSCGVVG